MSTLRFSILQTKLFWEQPEKNLDMFSKKISEIPNGPGVIVLPEMFSTGFSMQPRLLAEKMDGRSLQWMQQTAREKRCIVTGSLMIADDGKYYNRLIWMQPDGNFGYYDKRHLFAYAGEHNHYSPGTRRLIASANGFKINLQICYDLRFPVWARQQQDKNAETVHPEFDVLIYVANWPQKRRYAWRSLLIARAIENQCYVVGVNRVGDDGNGIAHCGDSMIIDPLGEILCDGAAEENIFTVSLKKEVLDEVRSRFPFWRDGDSFTIY